LFNSKKGIVASECRCKTKEHSKKICHSF